MILLTRDTAMYSDSDVLVYFDEEREKRKAKKRKDQF